MIKKMVMCLLTGILALTTPVFADSSIKTVNASEASDLETITNSEYAKLAEALDISSVNTTVDMGSGYKIFDINNDNFRNALNSQAFTQQSSDSASGKSSSEVASSYDRKFGLNAQINTGVATPVGKVGFNVNESFDTSINQSLAIVNDEYYEYWEITKIMKLVQIDWKSRCSDSFFSIEFKNDLGNVSDIATAKALLEKYGTHLFDNYYLGGTLSITRYICSQTSVEESYKENNSTFSLQADITNAVNANANHENYYITSNEVSNENTKTTTKVSAKGGNNLNGITPSELFTYKQEIASQYESGYVYSAWLKSVGNCESLRVVRAEKPVAIWDAIKNTSLFNEKTYQLLKDAFDVLCFENYSENCLKLEIAPGYIDSISYTKDDYNVNFNLNSSSISLPAGANAILSYGDLLLDNINEADINLTVSNGSSYVNLNGKNLSVNNDATGKTAKLEMSIFNQKIFELNINICTGAFKVGYGTVDQPYLIHDLGEWKQFVSNATYYSSSFELASDIDLKGASYTVGGATKKTGFFGNFNGAYHTIKNGTIISSAGWNYIGLFGMNYGNIGNLYLENIKVMNSGINYVKTDDPNIKPNIDAGILVGKNYGKLSRIGITDSSIRVVAQLDQYSSLNVGGIVGRSQGSITESFCDGINLYGSSYDGSGAVICGGLLGKLDNSSIDNCYVANSNINSSNYYNKFGANNDLYINKSDNKLYRKNGGEWSEIGTAGTSKPSDAKKNQYFYNTSEKKLYKKGDKDNWSEESILGTVLTGNKLPKNDIEETSYYCLGGLLGSAEGKSAVDFVVLYLNSFNQNNKKFGFVGGYADINTYFQNCYYEEQSTKAVNNSEKDGCVGLRTLTLDSIGNAEWNQYWCDGYGNHPVLKWEDR